MQAQDAVTVVLSGRIDKAMAGLRAKLETAHKTSGGKKVNLISHSMGGLLVRCFMSMNHDVSFHVFCVFLLLHKYPCQFPPFSRYSLSMSTNGFALLVHSKVTYWTFQLIYYIIVVLWQNMCFILVNLSCRCPRMHQWFSTYWIAICLWFWELLFRI